MATRLGLQALRRGGLCTRSCASTAQQGPRPAQTLKQASYGTQSVAAKRAGPIQGTNTSTPGAEHEAMGGGGIPFSASAGPIAPSGGFGGSAREAFKGIKTGKMAVGAAIVASAVIYSFETSYKFFKGLFDHRLQWAMPAMSAVEKMPVEEHKGPLHHRKAKDSLNVGHFKAMDEAGSLLTERDVLGRDNFLLLLVGEWPLDRRDLGNLAEIITCIEKTSHMAAGLVQPLVLLPSLPPGEEGLSALRQAKQQFHEELSKAHVHLRNPFKALAGHDTPKIAEKAEAFLEKGRGPAAVKEAEKKPVLYVIDPEGHFTMTFQAEDDHVEKQVQIYPSGRVRSRFVAEIITDALLKADPVVL